MGNRLAALGLLLGWVVAGSAAGRDQDLAGFIVGSYQLVGKNLDSAATHGGSAVIARSPAGLNIHRIIDGRTIVGTVHVEQATADRIPVVRIRYTDRGTACEQTCLVTSDLDNYPRLTCQVYVPGKATSDPGLEAYFPVK
ncbi:hypothetical protein Despr_1558 [Desulfobulbus propionicus DSM 2032]|jgi:hypothetical protein|uniref:Uncharacterized protein n=1 Tax=Desulfobulbus propionicus (strain ATCC 33891 / DSM 2032 / VKM B-1956 / 1pr3) TaxID=577650 RepID=A0A7U4DP72_DESPD|nr:hypothetical protein [Desulfobulbus propionicus]ADW17712.1 hypothetical protein Despr_1558 [Desulfobulbus propionicus DSM 2032]